MSFGLALVIDLIFVRAISEATGGRLCPTLDDAFIHFQYALSYAEGHPLSYQLGEGVTTGATSLLYPALLAPAFFVGFGGMAINLYSHGLAVLAMGVAGAGAGQLGRTLLGRRAGFAFALGLFAFPQLVLMALGGMEIAVFLAAELWALALATRWILRPEVRDLRGALLLVTAGAIACLARPEGVTGGLACALALFFFPVASARWTRALALLAVLPSQLPALIAWLTSGRARTSGQILKWYFADPYLRPEQMLDSSIRNLEVLVGTLMMGESWEHPVPPSFSMAALCGGAIILLGGAKRKGAKGALAALLLLGGAAGILLPTTYWTFRTNFGRYLWPFVPLWGMVILLGLLLLSRGLRSLFGLRRWGGRRPVSWAWAGLDAALVTAALVGFVSYGEPEAMLARFVDASSEICGQHLRMVEEIEERVPAGEIVAITDAGALTYLGSRRTYDLIGLTTPGAAPPSAEGRGSVFERLERLPRRERPTYIAYYRRWLFGLREIIGARIATVSISHADHVGDPTMILGRIRTELYHSGDVPKEPPAGEMVDVVDIADLESERAHAYRREGGYRLGNVVRLEEGPRPLADGCRELGGDAFRFRSRPGLAATWVTRIGVLEAGSLAISLDGRERPPLRLLGDGFVELQVSIPASEVGSMVHVRRELRRGRASFCHDWLYQGAAGSGSAGLGSVGSGSVGSGVGRGDGAR